MFLFWKLWISQDMFVVTFSKIRGWYAVFQIEKNRLVWVISRRLKLGLWTYMFSHTGSKKRSNNGRTKYEQIYNTEKYNTPPYLHPWHGKQVLHAVTFWFWKTVLWLSMVFIKKKRKVPARGEQLKTLKLLNDDRWFL